MKTDNEVRDAYRKTLLTTLREAESKGDRPMQQRVKLMIELHDKDIGTPIINQTLSEGLFKG